MDSALKHLTVNHELALEFLAVFSRFEFSLKVTRFRQPGEGEAKADWILFAKAIAQAFNPNCAPEVKAAFHYLTSQPLRYFGVQNGKLDWYPFTLPAVASDVETVVRLIRQVRNNLFHGGKYTRDPPSSPDRDLR